MPATAAQLANLVSVFGRNQALALIDYIDAQTQYANTNIAALTASVSSLNSNSVSVKGILTDARPLDTDFVISTTNGARVRYTLEPVITQTVLSLSTTTARADLLVNGAIIASVGKSLNATLTLGSQMGLTNELVLSSYVPPGATVHIATTLVSSGANTAVINFLSVQEELT